MNAKQILFAAKYFCLLLCAGCSGQLYQVAPLPANAPPVIATGSALGIGIGAIIFDEDKSVEQFEANLPLAGIIPVDVAIANQASQALNAKKLGFELTDAAGGRFKQISARKALGKVMSFYGDSFYRLDARQRTRESYEAVALKLDTALAPQEERHGFIFFETKNRPVDRNGLSLSVKGAGSPISVQLK
jgi:hypothetical protein